MSSTTGQDQARRSKVGVLQEQLDMLDTQIGETRTRMARAPRREEARYLRVVEGLLRQRQRLVMQMGGGHDPDPLVPVPEDVEALLLTEPDYDVDLLA